MGKRKKGHKKSGNRHDALKTIVEVTAVLQLIDIILSIIVICETKTQGRKPLVLIVYCRKPVVNHI